MLFYILLVGIYQLKTSISMEKRVILAVSNNHDAAAPPAISTRNATFPNENDTNNTTRGMSACLLVMDDTIKLTEWLAYHYTVLPLSHLIVAIDPASVLEKDIEDVFDLWKPRIYIEIWKKDTWMTLNETQGWPPSAYFPNGKLNRKRIAENADSSTCTSDIYTFCMILYMYTYLTLFFSLETTTRTLCHSVYATFETSSSFVGLAFGYRRVFNLQLYSRG